MVLVATQVKRRRGTTAENDAFTGAEGEITVDTEKHELRVHDGTTQGGHRLYTQAEVDEIVSTIGFPTGATIPFAGQTPPTGFFICDGSAISRTDYADLFSAIGTTYGDGDGSTTFNLPNLQGVRRIIDSSINGTTWYRLYDDGWVEQGGRGSPGFWIGMTNKNYTPLSTGIRPNFVNSYDCSSVANLSTSGFSVGGINIDQQVWYTCGQSSRGAQQQTKYIVKY